MNVSGNIDLFSVGIVLAFTVVLGLTAYINNRASITNKTFFTFSIITVFWGVVNYLSYQLVDLRLWLIRLVMSFAVFHAFLFYFFIYVFPLEKKRIHKSIKFIIIPIVIITSLLTLTPLVFSGLTIVPSGQVSQPIPGPGIVIFATTILLLIGAGLINLIRKTKKTIGVEKRKFVIILWGVTLMFALILLFAFYFPVVLDNVKFIPLSSIFVFPFIISVVYTIFKYQLFNIKVATTGLLVFLLSVVTFLEIIFTEFKADNMPILILRVSVFLLVLIFGILLIKGVLREVRQREQIQELADRLRGVNSILAHDVKATLGKNKDMFSALLDGDFGQVSEDAKPFLRQSFSDTKKLVFNVINVLTSGSDMTLNPAPFDFKEVVLETIRDVKPDADAKKISIETNISEKDYKITADKTQLQTHVLRNLLENAINYNTEGGRIEVSLEKSDNVIKFSVKDTGYGIKEEDKPNIFKEGGQGKDAIKINVHSSGYGLFSAKKAVDAHGGRIWFESEGVKGKGSTFFVELPIKLKSV